MMTCSHLELLIYTINPVVSSVQSLVNSLVFFGGCLCAKDSCEIFVPFGESEHVQSMYHI